MALEDAETLQALKLIVDQEIRKYVSSFCLLDDHITLYSLKLNVNLQ